MLSIFLLIGLAAAYTTGFPYSVRTARISAHVEKSPPLTDPFYRKYLQLRLVVTLLVFMVLWSVKATFLIFYRLLFDVSQTFIRVWWAAVALTFATFWVCIGSTFTLCGSASELYDFGTRGWPCNALFQMLRNLQRNALRRRLCITSGRLTSIGAH